MGAHDSGYKKLFAFPIMVEDLLRGFVREPWVAELDFSTLERKNGSYVADDLREREDDIIWRVKWRGQESWMYIYTLLEFQTEHEPFMGVRIMNYVSLLYQDLINTGGIPKGEKLPPVLPMVVYRGEQKWRSPLDVKGLIRQPPAGFSRYLPSLRYLLLEEVRMNDDELERMSNLVAEIFRIEKSASVKASIPPFLSFWKWTTRAGAQQDSLRRALKVWFKQAQKPAKIIGEDDAMEDMSPEEMEPMLSERMEKWTSELRAEGKTEGKTELLLSLFEMKFGSPSDEIRARVASASAEEILRLSGRLLTADTPADVFLLD